MNYSGHSHSSAIILQDIFQLGIFPKKVKQTQAN